MLYFPWLTPTESNHSSFIFPLHFICTCLYCSSFFFVSYYLGSNLISPFILLFEWFPRLTLFIWDLIFCTWLETKNYFLNLYFPLEISLFFNSDNFKKDIYMLVRQGIRGQKIGFKKIFSPCNRDSKLLGTLWNLLDLNSMSRQVIPKLTTTTTTKKT